MNTDVKVGLWVQQGKNGDSYMSGKDQYGNKIYVRKNMFKKTDKQPTYLLTYQASDQVEVVELPKKTEEPSYISLDNAIDW